MRNTRFSADLKVVNFVNFRPDLLDWRQVERRDVRERIDLAFHIMDREYGVTRLLDPEGECTDCTVQVYKCTDLTVLYRLNIDTRIQMRLTRWQLASTSGLRVRNLNWYQHTKMKINYCPKWLNDMHINQTQLPMMGQNEAELMNDNWTLQY